MIITTLFQEDNIIGTGASLTYCPQIQSRLCLFENNRWIIYNIYREYDVYVHRACWKQATQPLHIWRGGTIYPGSKPVSGTKRSPS